MAREQGLLPYFRVLEGPAGPVVDMEGADKIMLGSNNYLGPDRRRSRASRRLARERSTSTARPSPARAS